MISYTRAKVELIRINTVIKSSIELGNETQKKIDSNIGLMARSERLFFLFISSIISYFFNPNFFFYFLIVFLFLVLFTFLFRFSKYKIILDNS